MARRSALRAIALLAVASFASQAMIRAADTLLPQIAADFAVTVGTASIVITAYAVSHGSMQFVIGPAADRIGKYRTVAIACALSALTVALCGLAQSLNMLAVARLASGATAAWILPVALAYVGDVVPYEQRQQVLGRFLAGQVLGQMFGQAAGGVIGDYFGWRNVFFLLSAMFTIAAAALAYELATNAVTRSDHETPKGRGLRADYIAIFSNPWARFVLLVTFLEAALFQGVFPFVGADLHLRFGLSFSAIGLVVGTFAFGGLLYAATVKPLMQWLGQSGIAGPAGSPSGWRFSRLRRSRSGTSRRWRRSAPDWASTCCTTPCRPKARKWCRRRAAPRLRCSPRSIFSARPPTWRWPRRWWTASARRRCSSSAPCCCRSWPGGSRPA
jgi:predicted MFS family arabinose efflux permease